MSTGTRTEAAVAGDAPRRPAESDWSVLMARSQAGDADSYRRLLMEIAPYLRALAHRHALYQEARQRMPERWSGTTRNWTPVGAVTLNPEREQEQQPQKKAA